ncbi:MAG: BlaI/MecI/CopY family transcriptional regulator [Planctomycetota bacterium]
MVPAKDSPTPAEWKVLRIVWERGECAARDVVEAGREEHGWSTSTVKTLLRRLVEKGHLKTRRVGNSFLYRPGRSTFAALRRAADDLLASAAQHTVGPLLAYLLRRSQLNAKELDELRSLLDEKEEDA